MKKHFGSLFGLLALAVAPALLGCPPPLPSGAVRPPSSADLELFDAVLTAAPAAGVPVTERCREERAERLVVVDATDQTMRRWAGYCASQSDICVQTAAISDAQERSRARGEAGCLLGLCAGGSTVWEQDDIWPANFGRWRAVVFVSAYEDAATRRRLVLHEAVHWLGGCSGTGVDHTHSRLELWGPDGVEQRAAASALRP